MHNAALPSRAAFGYFLGMKHFAALVGLAIAVALPQARAQQNPDDQYIAIYSLIQQAEALQAADQPRSALAGYTQALAELQKFQKVFPDWDSKIVSFRLNYLAEKVNGLTAQLPAIPQNVVPPPALPTPTNSAVNPTPPPLANPVSAAPATDAEMQLSALRAQAQDLQSENETLQAKLKEAFERGWAVIVWNDPVNLMDYVVYVFKTVLKMNEKEASRHMWEVHQKGKSMVARETREGAETIVDRLRGFGLNATMEGQTPS